MNLNTAMRVLQPLAPSANANPLDVVKIKSALGTLGHYEAPDWGLSQFPDPALFKAIQAFQRKRGLAVDGVMRPGGPTEASLRAALTPQQTDAALYATAQTIRALGRHGDTLLAHITPEEAYLLDAITDGASINPATGLLEFWSTKGGYSGPDRTYTSKHSDGGDSFDASADHKAMQRSVMTRSDNGGRNDFDTRATSGQETLGSGNSLTAQSAARTAPSAAPTDTEARTRAARAVIAPDNDPSFTAGFFEAKQNEAARKKAEEDAKERERQIWGGQQYWSEKDLPLSRAPKKDYPMSYALGTAENPLRQEDSRGFLNDIRDIGVEQAQEKAKKMAIRAIGALLDSALLGLNHFSPILMLPSTKEEIDKMQNKDIKA